MFVVMIPTLTSRDAFGPSYSDLKFTIWNWNYFFINTILKGKWRHTLRMVDRLLSWTCMPQGAKNWNLLHTRAVLVVCICWYLYALHCSFLHWTYISLVFPVFLPPNKAQYCWCNYTSATLEKPLIFLYPVLIQLLYCCY